ncbi:hypothetical protein PR048_007954 [Dryococelus australis]|uniref:Uncharacterized protein n=1 Tax=Dryococelus australis TaxID=614101 RepID=A0ABQ9HVQ1_9NEOP|nr:hypothetical protein PR048_007954 [Dryococelus australis]
MEQCRNARVGETGDPQENPLTSDIVQHGGTEIIAFTPFPDFCPRKDYTRPSTIKKDLSNEKKSEDPDLGTERCLRSSVDVFNIKQDCLYCGEETSDSVVARALERGDAWGEIVPARAVSVADLVAAEAKYHKQCRLLFASPGKSSIVILKGSASSILHNKWYLDKRNTEEEENIRIVEAAAGIIRVIQGEVVERKNTAIGEAIMSACSPRSYTYPTIMVIGVYIHRHHASRQLVDILSSLSFSASYKEVQSTTEPIQVEVRKDISNMPLTTLILISEPLHGTFHSMGDVRLITPAQNQESMTVNRLLHPPSADTIATRSKLQVNCYKKSALPGLKGINIRELATAPDTTARSVKNAIAADVLWSSARWLEESLAPSWNFEECKHHNQGSCIVTFDQPLYAKVSEIIALAPGELDNVTLWLGGVHLLVSFIDSIGFIMSGRMENLFGVYQEELHKLFLEVSTGEKMIPDAVESSALVSFLASFERKCTALSEQSRTGKLWVQYLRQVDILRRFTRAERSGDWELHIQYVRSMLPYLHAAGHFHYANSAPLYVQQMEKLPPRMPPHEYNKFTSEGFFTVRRKNEFWRRVWTDLSIEQDLMSAFPICLKLCNALEELSGMKTGSSEQHVELRDSRRTRDARDVAVLLSWLKEHSPWDVDYLRSLAPGVVGEDSVNCDQSEYVGLGAIKCIIGSNFCEVKLTQKNRVKPLSEVARSILIRDDVVEGDADTLIAEIALELASVGNNVTVVASDTDIVVMLLARATDDMELRVLSPEKFVIALYGGINVNSLDELRVIQHTRSIAKQSVMAAFKLATLPPTSAACAEHSLKDALPGFLVPILTRWAPARESLLRRFPVAVRQTVATDVNAGVLDWPARQCVDIVEEEVA